MKVKRRSRISRLLKRNPNNNRPILVLLHYHQNLAPRLFIGGFLFAPIVDNIEYFGGGVYERLCAGFEKFIGGSVAPDAADGKHPRGYGRLHIGAGIAKVKELFGRNSQFLCDLQRHRGVGLQWDIRQRPLNNFESPLRKDFFDHNLRETVVFIGKDYQR